MSAATGMFDALVRTRGGAWVISNDTHVGKWVEETGRLDHDRWMLDKVEPMIPAGGTVVDVGALYGDHTIAYSRRVGPKGHVLAFEPNLVAFRALVKNMKYFGCDNVECYPTALGAQGGVAYLQVQRDNIGMTRMVDKMGENVQEAAVETIDEQGLKRLDFLKIDAEGEELAILKGALKTLERCKPTILMEVNRSRLELRGTTPNSLLRYLFELGYKGHPIQPDLTIDAEQFDYIARPI